MFNTCSFLIVDTYYFQFLKSIYNKFPDLSEKSYAEQRDFMMAQCFGTADFYSKNLKKLGCEAEEIIPNNDILQMKWASKAGMKTEATFIEKIANRLPGIKRRVPALSMPLKILKEQIKRKRPDILYMQDLSFCPPSYLAEMKKYVKLVIGQIACPIPPLNYLKPYDLILTSFPHYVGRFREMGINSEYFKIAFDPSALEKADKPERTYPCTFIGGISPAHKKGTELLEELARRVEIDFFGYGAETLDKNSPILPRHHGEVWGLDMYRALLSSRITINRHIDVAENNANNMRLYEATGCRAMLITDNKDNLYDLFATGKEVVAYRDTDELVDLINYYSENEDKREEIALAGQRRTLNDHTYSTRMQELIEIINNYI